MRRSSQRDNDIAELAQAIADEHCPSGKIDPLVIAEAKGITHSFGFYGGAFDGLLEHRAGRFHIYCNLARSGHPGHPRVRFTLGHELAHYFMDEHRHALESGRVPSHPSVCDFESKNPVELEADFFSANLIMPSTRFLSQAKALEAGLPAVLAMAETFGTSVQSTAIRYVQLNVGACTLIKWSHEREFQWTWFSPDTFKAGFRKTIESREKLPDGSATTRAQAGEEAGSVGFLQVGGTASAWFPFVGVGSRKDIILVEQAIQLGPFGVLTVLCPETEVYP